MQILAIGILIVGNRTYSNNHEQGFTLLEMMLVVVLIALTVSFINLNLSPDPEDILHREGSRVIALLKQLQDESVFTGKPMAMELNEFEQDYSFLMPDKDNWIVIDDDELFRTRSFVSPVKARLEVEGQITQNSEQFVEQEAAIINPKIVVDPVGGISNFSLLLSAEKASILITLDDRAQIVIKSEEEER